MREFILKLFFLILIPGFVLFTTVLLSPPNEAYKRSMLYSFIDKNTLMKNMKSPRIIFVGGSNLSFGLDSKRIRDTFNINPINTGIDASIGLKFMMANIEEYIKEGDIVILSPEYIQFYSDLSDGELSLLSIIVDVSPDSRKLLTNTQILKLCGYLPELFILKLRRLSIHDRLGIYERNSFNSFGDAVSHWGLPRQTFSSEGIEGDLNEDIFHFLDEFRYEINEHGAELYISFPCIQDSSFDKSFAKIMQVDSKLKKYGFNLLADPIRYRMPDSLMFNSIYHLTKQGVEFRTTLLIEDLKRVISYKPKAL